MAERTRTGKRRHRVTIQSKTASQNDYGEPVYTWSDVATVWASVNDLTAQELIQGPAELQRVRTIITMRDRSDVTPETRIVWGSHTYDVESVVHQGSRVYMDVLCTEVI